MGRVLAPFGIKGWIKARPFSAVPAALLDHELWWLGKDEQGDDWREFRVVNARLHAGTLVAELEGFATRESAMSLRGAWIGVPRAALPKIRAGEFYRSELSGLAVVNRQGEALGRVVGFLDTGAHPVLRLIAEDGSERLIPWVAAYVDEVDSAAGRIQVDWQRDF